MYYDHCEETKFESLTNVKKSDCNFSFATYTVKAESNEDPSSIHVVMKASYKGTNLSFKYGDDNFNEKVTIAEQPPPQEDKSVINP